MTEFEREKQEKIDRIILLHTEMTELILYNGIRQKAWSEIIEDLVNKRSSVLDKIEYFFEKLYAGLWQEMKVVWEQPNMMPEMWHNYRLFSYKPLLAEQKQMDLLKKKLQPRWAAFKRDINTKLPKEPEKEPIDESDQAPKQTTT